MATLMGSLTWLEVSFPWRMMHSNMLLLICEIGPQLLAWCWFHPGNHCWRTQTDELFRRATSRKPKPVPMTASRESSPFVFDSGQNYKSTTKRTAMYCRFFVALFDHVPTVGSSSASRFPASVSSLSEASIAKTIERFNCSKNRTTIYFLYGTREKSSKLDGSSSCSWSCDDFFQDHARSIVDK